MKYKHCMPYAVKIITQGSELSLHVIAKDLVSLGVTKRAAFVESLKLTKSTAQTTNNCLTILILYPAALCAHR